jgi:hypothetical protein
MIERLFISKHLQIFLLKYCISDALEFSRFVEGYVAFEMKA